MKDNKILLIVIAALMVVSIAATGVLIFTGGSAQPTSTVTSSEETENTISVSSSGSVTVLPDVGYISLGVETKNAEVIAAQAQNTAIMTAIADALADLEIADTDIKTTSYYIYPQYEDYTDELPIYYQVSSTIEITVKNIENISDVIGAAIGAGANNVSSISFGVLEREGAYNQALELAIAGARDRAEVLAEAAGLKIVGVVTLNENSSIPPIYYSDARMYSYEDSYSPYVATGDMEITANVSVVYEVTNK